MGAYYGPLVLLADFYASVLTAVLAIRLNEKLLPGIPMAYWYFASSALHLFTTSMGYYHFKEAENLTDESLATLKAYQRKWRSEMQNGGTINVGGISRNRIFKRRPLTLRISFFMAIRSGMGLEFLQAVLDNVVTGIMTIDMTVPSRLLRMGSDGRA